jgi:hypothetical protein
MKNACGRIETKIAAANSHIPVDAMMAFSFLLSSSRFPLDEFSHASVFVLVSGFPFLLFRNNFHLKLHAVKNKHHFTQTILF